MRAIPSAAKTALDNLSAQPVGQHYKPGPFFDAIEAFLRAFCREGGGPLLAEYGKKVQCCTTAPGTDFARAWKQAMPVAESLGLECDLAPERISTSTQLTRVRDLPHVSFPSDLRCETVDCLSPSARPVAPGVPASRHAFSHASACVRPLAETIAGGSRPSACCCFIRGL
jgi:hypothetical protein